MDVVAVLGHFSLAGDDSVRNMMDAIAAKIDQPWIWIDTGVRATWVVNELVIPVRADDVQDVLRIVAHAVRREVLS